MIKIKYITSIPQNIDPTSSVYRKVLNENINVFLNHDPANVSSVDFNFGGYENQSNKKIIRKITSGRCAYCGLRITDSSQLEVEHYWPKKRLDIRCNEFILHKKSNHTMNNNRVSSIKFGYFVVGNSYKNLLPACSVCNKGIDNVSIVVDKQLFSNIPFGKRNYFPVSHRRIAGKRGDPRLGKAGMIRPQDEVSLLFNPYLDDPNILFSYKRKVNVEGTFYIKICTGKNLKKQDKLKSILSINLLGLNRVGLCLRRSEIYDGLLSLKRNIAADKRVNNSRIFIWASHAIDCAKYFDSSTGVLIGYARNVAGDFPGELRSLIKDIFGSQSRTILTEEQSFDVIIKELKNFGDKFYDEDELSRFDDDINNIII